MPVPVVGLKIVASPRWRYVLVYSLLGAKYYGYLVLPPSIELKVIVLCASAVRVGVCGVCVFRSLR